MHERAVRGRAWTPRERTVYHGTARTALYGFPIANRDHLLVWRREMRSEGVANGPNPNPNDPNGQRFCDQKTLLCLLHLPTVLQRLL